MQQLPSQEPARKGKFSPKLTSRRADEVRQRYLDGETLTRLAAEFAVTVGALSRIVHNHTYRESAARVAMTLSAASAIALAQLEARTGLPRRRLAERVFERGLEALAREPPK